MKKLSKLAIVTAIAIQAGSSMADVTMIPQNAGEQYTYTPDQALFDAISPLRTGFYDQNINLPESNQGDPMSVRPQFQIYTTQPATGLYPFNQTVFGTPSDPFFIRTSGGQGPNNTQGEAHLMIHLTIMRQAEAKNEFPGKRLLITKGEFNVRTALGHSRSDSQAYVTVYCGSRLLNDLNNNTIRHPATNDAKYFYVTPQVQISDFDFATCKEDVHVYYVVDAMDIQFKSLTWMITQGIDAPNPTDPTLPANLVPMCQYKHKTDTAGGQKGAVNFLDATGNDKTCEPNGDWKTACKDGNGNTDEIGCVVPSKAGASMCQYKHKKDTKGGKQGQTNAFDANGKQKSCDKNGDWKTTCKDGNGDTDEVACK